MPREKRFLCHKAHHYTSINILYQRQHPKCTNQESVHTLLLEEKAVVEGPGIMVEHSHPEYLH